MTTQTQRVAESISNLYEKLPESSERVIAISAAALAVGVTGYLIGKSKWKRTPLRNLAKEASSAEANLDLSPVFKFLKLWMLYRVSV